MSFPITFIESEAVAPDEIVAIFPPKHFTFQERSGESVEERAARYFYEYMLACKPQVVMKNIGR